MTEPLLVGRSSSHFTRTVRIFAIELGVALRFRAVMDITSQDPEAFAGNPALKVPVLVDEEGLLVGTENICRALARRATTPAKVVHRGDVADRVVANAEELTLHVMSSEVSLIMAKVAGNEQLAPPKVRLSIASSLGHLDSTIDRALTALPADRTLSFLETTLFCTVVHLSFREVMDVSGYRNLEAFARRFAERESARQTEYRFDTA